MEYGASKITAAQAVVNYLNSVGLKARGQATGQVPGCFKMYLDICIRTDIEEAYLVGMEAVRIAMDSGQVDGHNPQETRKAIPGYYDKVPLEEWLIPNAICLRKWISKSGIDVTDEFIEYAMPLIGDGGLMLK